MGGKRLSRGGATGTNEFGQVANRFRGAGILGDDGGGAIHNGGKAYRLQARRLSPERKWTIHFVPHAHLEDIGYTDYQAKVAELQTEHRQAVGFLADASGDAIQSGRFVGGAKLFCDAQRGGARTTAAVHSRRQGERSGAVLELADRVCEPGGTDSFAIIRTRCTGPKAFLLTTQNITDVPSVSWSYPSVLNAAGIRYFAEATNSDRGPIVLYGKWNEKSPFWREGWTARKY